MAKRYKYTCGNIIGNNIIYIKFLYSDKFNSKVSLFKCHCGNKFEKEDWSIRNQSTISCGCLNKITHNKCNMSNHFIYTRWRSIKSRCYNKNKKSYINYGAKGIVMYDNWKKNVLEFFNYIKNLDSYDENLIKKGILTIDRIDNTKGYFPENIRWANKHVQSANRNIGYKNTSGINGVTYIKKSNKWLSKITINNNQIWLGSFILKDDAIKARQKYIKDNNLLEYGI